MQIFRLHSIQGLIKRRRHTAKVGCTRLLNARDRRVPPILLFFHFAVTNRVTIEMRFCIFIYSFALFDRI